MLYHDTYFLKKEKQKGFSHMGNEPTTFTFEADIVPVIIHDVYNSLSL